MVDGIFFAVADNGKIKSQQLRRVHPSTVRCLRLTIAFAALPHRLCTHGFDGMGYQGVGAGVARQAGGARSY